MKINQQKPGPVSWGAWHKVMALWAREYDLKVSLKEWYFPASRLSRHWSMYYDCATDKLYAHNQDLFLQYARNQEEGIFTLNKTLNERQQTQQFLCKSIHLTAQKRGQAITVMGCKDPSLTL
eukprot:11178517-Ditylum_brightwellii.AAC.1